MQKNTELILQLTANAKKFLKEVGKLESDVGRLATIVDLFESCEADDNGVVQNPITVASISELRTSIKSLDKQLSKIRSGIYSDIIDAK